MSSSQLDVASSTCGEAAGESIEAAALRGERPAIEAVWQLHRRWIAAVLLAYKPRCEDLDDLLQEVAMTLLTKITQVREAGNVRAWLRSVAINVARAAGRSERARPVQRLSNALAESSSGEYRGHNGSASRAAARVAAIGPAAAAASHGDMHDEAQRIMRLASELPETYREPLLLKAINGMRTRQISEILGLPEATVDTRISRARRMLREQAAATAMAGRTLAAADDGRLLHPAGKAATTTIVAS